MYFLLKILSFGKIEGNNHFCFNHQNFFKSKGEKFGQKVTIGERC